MLKGAIEEILMIMDKLEQFIASILETRKVWLLEAKEGFFAMLEDDNGDPYIPLWESEALAAKAAQGDWEGYTVTDMGFSELGHWLKELAADDIDIAVSPEADGEITAIPSHKFRNWLKPYDDHSYKERMMMVMMISTMARAGRNRGVS